MSAPVYLGDEISAAGFRLAGARVRIPAPGDEAAEFAIALGEAPLVLLSAAVAARIADPELQAALAAPEPLVLIVPGTGPQGSVPDLEARMRRQLGMLA